MTVRLLRFLMIGILLLGFGPMANAASPCASSQEMSAGITHHQHQPHHTPVSQDCCQSGICCNVAIFTDVPAGLPRKFTPLARSTAQELLRAGMSYPPQPAPPKMA